MFQEQKEAPSGQDKWSYKRRGDRQRPSYGGPMQVGSAEPKVSSAPDPALPQSAAKSPRCLRAGALAEWATPGFRPLWVLSAAVPTWMGRMPRSWPGSGPLPLSPKMHGPLRGKAGRPPVPTYHFVQAEKPWFSGRTSGKAGSPGKQPPLFVPFFLEHFLAD